MASTIKVNNIQNQCGANIANKCETTITLGASGDTITLACGASQTGFGRTGTVDWDTTAKTTSFTAVSGNGYFVNTTSGAITVTLPAGSAGSIVSLKDYANTWNTNNVTVTPNGTDKINGINDNAALNTQDQSVTLIYVDSTKGWRVVQDSTSDVTGAEYITATGGTVTCCGDYKIHTFTSPGTFTVCSVGNAGGSNSVDYLVVAGGGGATGDIGGGGGAGGFRLSNSTCMSAPLTSPLATPTALPVSVQGYPITIGGGGSGSPSGNAPTTASSPGSNSSFSSITSAGGGGSNWDAGDGGSNGNGFAGGSGGGAKRGASHSGGTGNTPPVSPPQGQSGGNTCAAPNISPTTRVRSAGGGGAGGAGTQGYNPSPLTGAGGIGSYVVSAGFAGCNGTTGPVCGARYFSGGGSGGGNLAAGSPPTTGTAGGGGGSNSGDCGPNGDPGVANTGGGGSGGGNDSSGGAGGSGIVIIRYKYQ
jgi:hypothetical protein